MRTVLAVLAAAGAIALIVAFYPALGPQLNPGANPGPGSLAGAPAQSFPLRRADGTPDSLANYRGKIVYMNLWATWCPPCRHEMPALERFYNEYRARGVVVLGVDQGEAPRVASAYARAHGITYPILIDEDQRYGSAYKSIGLPTTIIIDRAGRVVRGVDGEMTAAQMRAYLAPVLSRR